MQTEPRCFATPQTFVERVASLPVWSDEPGKSDPPPAFVLSSHLALMNLIEEARAIAERQAAYEPSVLIPDHPEESGSDFILRSDAKSAWITVDTLSIHIIRHEDGVEVLTHPKSCEDEDLEQSYTCFDDAETAVVDFHDLDLDEVADWVLSHHSLNFDEAPPLQRYAWIQQYLETHPSSTHPNNGESPE